MKSYVSRGKAAVFAALLIGFGLVLAAQAAVTEEESEEFPRTGPTPRPSAREWSSEAKEAQLTRVMGPTAQGCKALVLREWLRVTCPDVKAAAVSLVGGEAKDAYFHVESQDAEKSGLPGGGEFVIAVRPGDLRVIQFWTFGPGYDGPLTVIGSLIFQESWLKEERRPTLILSDVLHEPIRTATQEGK